MTIEVAIVADDLTGALDAAAPFVRAGRTAIVSIDPSLSDFRQADADVLAVSTGTRDLSEAAAAREVGRVARLVTGLRPRLLFKKIDSTLRGHVAAETVAMLAAGGLLRAVVCPAVPAQGRIVRDGRVFVHGVPLAEWLPAAEAKKLRHAGSLPGLFESVSQDDPGFDLSFPDAAEPADLDRIARSVSHAPGEVLVVGASGLAAALAGPGRAARRPVLAGPFLFVTGSRTRETAAQAAALAGVGGVMVVKAGPAGDVSVDPSARVVLLVPDERAVPPGSSPADVAGWLAAAAERVIARLAPASVILTGGDTAVAVLRRHGCRSLAILGEFEPGIPVSAAKLAGRQASIVTKAGGFGDEGLFVRIAGAG